MAGKGGRVSAGILGGTSLAAQLPRGIEYIQESGSKREGVGGRVLGPWDKGALLVPAASLSSPLKSRTQK